MSQVADCQTNLKLSTVDVRDTQRGHRIALHQAMCDHE